MTDQYSGHMMIDLDNTVAKTLKPYDFPQHGVFTLDIVPYFNIIGWLPFVLMAEVAKDGINGAKANGITLMNTEV